MEAALKLCWFLLAAIHAAPAAALFRPALIESLYGVAADGSAGVLLIHRGALFLAVMAVSLLAVFAPDARQAASLVAGISIVGFLIVYRMTGAPPALCTIALVDTVALLPLAFVVTMAWWR